MNDTTSRPKTLSSIPRRKLALALILPVVGMGVMWLVFWRPMEDRKKLRENGVRVDGRILDVETTGARYNKSPELRLTLEYRRRDGVTDTATTLFVPKRRFIQLYHPGAAVVVAYDSADPHTVTVADIADEVYENHEGHRAVDPNLDSLRHAADSLRRAVDSAKSRTGR
jgi:hypothetical protein